MRPKKLQFRSPVELLDLIQNMEVRHYLEVGFRGFVAHCILTAVAFSVAGPE